jgi:two-component system chemotaxis sensor kinase CheA
MSLRTRAGDVKTILNRGEMLSFQGDLIPLFRIDRTFGIEGAVSVPEDGLVIIVEEDGRRAGLLADALLGQQQIVIKTLGESMRGIPGISGGAIMPDGNVGLIMDVGGLVRLSQNAQGVSNPAGELVA